MSVAKGSIGDAEELNTPPPSNVTSQGNSQVTVYSENRTEAAGLDADFNSTSKNNLAVGNLIEIFPTSQLVTDICDNVPNIEKVTKILIKEKSEIQPNNQVEAKMPLKSLGVIGKGGRGRQRANVRSNPTLPNNSSVGHSRIKQTETQGEAEQYRQKSYASAGAYPNQRNYSTIPARVNEEHLNTHRRPTSMASMPPARATARMYTIPSQQYVPCGGQNRETRNRCHQSNNVEQHTVRSNPVIHHEGSSFIAITICLYCGNKKEHILYEPGTWPIKQCTNCRNNWVITDWKKYESDNIDIMFIGEVLNNIPARQRRPPTIYDANIIKTKPDDLANIPSCIDCGGHHMPTQGQPWNAGFSPNNPYSNWNL